MSLAAVGFDLDYTLCVPDRDRARLLKEAAAAVNVPAIDRSDYLAAHRQHLTGETRAPIFETLLDEPSDGTATALADAYRERVNAALRPVAGAHRLLATLRERYAVGLLTNGPSVAQRGKLEALGFGDTFDVVLVSGELPAGKPDRRAFRSLVDQLGVPREELVYVGDDVEADVGGATAAGCRVVQVVRPGGPDPDPGAAAVVSLTDLAESLPRTLADLD